MPSNEFEGKVALITGGTTGMGRAAARLFARQGASVVVAGRSPEDGEEAARLIAEDVGRDRVMYVRTDVSVEDDVKALVQKAIDRYGRIDCAFNNAGLSIKQMPLVETSLEIWSQCLSVNLTGTFLSLKYQIPAIARTGGGAIVNMSSIAGVVGMPLLASYTATKGGIIAMTRCAAIECVKTNVRINSISPGAVDTRMFRDTYPTDVAVSKAIDAHPMRRLASPDELAESIVWMCSSKASFMTGQNIVIDGGYTSR